MNLKNLTLISIWQRQTIENGKAEYFKIENVFKEMEYFRATSAMPFVSQFVEINGQKYLDGGIADSIPFEKAQELVVIKSSSF